MGALKTIGTVALLVAAGVSGYLAKSNDVNGFSLQQQGQNTILCSETLNKGYELNIINQEAYLGDAEHHYNGLRALTNYELVFGEIPFVGNFEPEQTGIEKLVDKVKDLI